MPDHERRRDYGELKQGIEDIKKTQEEIRQILQGQRGDNGLCGRVGKVELRVDRNENDIKKHKDNHWQAIVLAVTVFGVVAGLIIRFV